MSADVTGGQQPPSVQDLLAALPAILGKEVARQVEAAFKAARPPVDPRDTIMVNDVIDRYFQENPDELVPEVLADRVNTCRRFAKKHGGKRVEDCGPLDLSGFLRDQVTWKSPWTKKRALAHIKRVFRWAVEMRLTRAYPFQGVKARQGPRRRPMTDDNFQMLMRYNPPRLRRLFVWLKFTGCRPSEAAKLRWSDGAVVTLDAMGCQTEIAAKIREKKADYILAVKGNQEHLEEDVIAEFAKLDEPDGRAQASASPDVYETEDQGHGRQEQRCCEALPVPSTLRNKDKWKDIKSLCRVTRIYTERGQEKSEVRYFISSLPAKAKKLALGVRGHWGIENGLHWVLDMAFGEDRSRARKGHAQENLALLRRWMISLLRQDKTIPGGIEKKRLQAGWNTKNLETLLRLF